MPINIDAAQVLINAKVTGGSAIKGLATDLKGLSSPILGLSDAFGTLQGFLGRFGGALAVAEIAHAAKDAVEYAAKIDDVARSVNIGTSALQELRFAAVQNGLSADQLDGALSKLNLTLGKAKLKGDEARTAFDKLGIDPDKIKDSEQGFNTVIDQLRKIEDPAKRAALSMEIFGREAGPKFAQFIEQGTDGLAKLRKAAEDSGAVLDEDVIQNATEANNQLSAMNLVIKTELTQSLINLKEPLLIITQLFADLVALPRNFAESLAFLSAGADSPMKRVEARIAAINEEMQSGIKIPNLAAAMEGGGAAFTTFGGPDAARMAALRAERDRQENLRAALQGIENTAPHKAATGTIDLSAKGGAKEEAKDIDTLLGKYAAQQSALRDLTAAQIKLNDWHNKGKITDEQFSAAIEGVSEAYAALGAEDEDATSAAYKHADALKDLQDEMNGVGDEEDKAAQRRALLTELYAEGRITQEQYNDALADAAGAYETMDKAADETMQTLSAFADQSARNLQSLVAGFLAGERAGESFGKSVISMLQRVAAELASQALLTALFNVIGSATGTGTLGTTLFGGITKRAGGGSYVGGEPVIVGEKGPELLVPGRSGTVIPNHALGGGRSIAVTYNIDARNTTPEVMPALQAMGQRLRGQILRDVRELTARERLI